MFRTPGTKIDPIEVNMLRIRARIFMLGASLAPPVPGRIREHRKAFGEMIANNIKQEDDESFRKDESSRKIKPGDPKD
jgi:hypothetical protein